MLDTPIAFIVFNRPAVTLRVFEAIAQAKPKKLLVVADGPRFPEEAEKCRQARAVIENVDWDCEILTNFSETNMGCKRRVSSGLDWVFAQVEEAIILEDDCLPDTSFFTYCAELLEKYRATEEVMMVTGCNFQNGKSRTSDSYFFSRYAHVWGWASWRRAWRHYDVEMKSWSHLRQTEWLQTLLGDTKSAAYWTEIFDYVSQGEIDTWDYQWLFACWMSNGLTIHPDKNLMTNIGFGEDATHTTSASPYANLQAFEMSFPLQHPELIERNISADRYTSEKMFVKALEQNKPFSGLKRNVRGIINYARSKLLSSPNVSQAQK